MARWVVLGAFATLLLIACAQAASSPTATPSSIAALPSSTATIPATATAGATATVGATAGIHAHTHAGIDGPPGYGHAIQGTHDVTGADRRAHGHSNTPAHRDAIEDPITDAPAHSVTVAY
jgi:hypothetical protein